MVNPTSSPDSSHDSGHDSPHDSSQDSSQDSFCMPEVPASTGDRESKWQDTVNQAVRAVVCILSYTPRSFDTKMTCANDATGFIVDAKRGIVLTNRHVSGPGPFRGRCIFHNQEEVEVKTIYYDPVHDFGFLQFDPSAVKCTDFGELKLKPELIKVGLEIRVIGNDASQKLSIANGFISRVNRDAPVYDGYTDFNTNYIQGSAMTSNGSSGSPVLDIGGCAVALNAGSFTNASVALFLPLDQPAKALRYVVNGELVPRGTIQTQWNLKPFHECRTLGVPEDWISKIQALYPEEVFMLVAKSVLPDGPADSKLEEGDVLLRANGKEITLFNDLTKVLDDNVAGSVNIVVQRGDQEINVDISVQDLHQITPTRYVKVAGGVFHDFSYILAQKRRLSLKDCGVYLCVADGSFNIGHGGHLIQSIDDKPTKTLAELETVIQAIPDRKLVRIRYKALSDIHRYHNKLIQFDRSLCRTEIGSRDFTTGSWILQPLPENLAPSVLPQQVASISSSDCHQFPHVANILDAIVSVKAYFPLPIDGFTSGRLSGYGMIVDAAQGLVLVPRDNVPHNLGRCTVTISSEIIIPAKIVFLDPSQNFAFLQYDPDMVRARVPSVVLSETDIKIGERALFFRLNRSGMLELSSTAVAGMSTVFLQPEVSPGRRAVVSDYLMLDSSLGMVSGGSGLVSEDGIVQAICLGRYCMLSSTVAPVLEMVRKGVMPEIKPLGVVLSGIGMLHGRERGVPQEWMERVKKTGYRRFLSVSKLFAGHESGLEDGDVILTINDELITHASPILHHNQAPTLSATIVRNCSVQNITVTAFPHTNETDRVISFCGAFFHSPHMGIRQKVSKVSSEVYISGYYYGSPSQRFDVAPGIHFVTQLNGAETPDLDTFVAEARKIPDNTYFRIAGMSTKQIRLVKTIKRDEHYFPMVEFRRDPEEVSGWRVVPLQIQDTVVITESATNGCRSP